ncbi:MAG: PfkB family carbohydrate kinase [Anaerolineae bacterium]
MSTCPSATTTGSPRAAAAKAANARSSSTRSNHPRGQAVDAAARPPPRTPDFVALGHVALDLTDDGWILGGTAAYAASTARNLGRRAAVVTSAEDGLDLAAHLPDIQIEASGAPATTTFRNTYTEEGRIQWLHSRAAPLTPADVPGAWREAPIALLAPIAREVSEDLADLFPRALLGISLQGWLRRWDTAGRVTPAAWEPSARFLARADALILSEQDLTGIQEPMMPILEAARLTVLTQGDRGATLLRSGDAIQIPAPTSHEVDPTGAGDVFAAAFLIQLAQTRDPVGAVAFANRAAALSVRGPGLTAVPTREEVEGQTGF